MRDPWLILKWAFRQIVTMSIVIMMHNPRFTRIHSSPKETQLQKCCVSFGKDCSFYPLSTMQAFSTLGVLCVHLLEICESPWVYYCLLNNYFKWAKIETISSWGGTLRRFLPHSVCGGTTSLHSYGSPECLMYSKTLFSLQS